MRFASRFARSGPGLAGAATTSEKFVSTVMVDVATGKTIVVFGARPKMKTKPPLAAAAGRTSAVAAATAAPQGRRSPAGQARSR